MTHIDAIFAIERTIKEENEDGQAQPTVDRLLSLPGAHALGRHWPQEMDVSQALWLADVLKPPPRVLRQAELLPWKLVAAIPAVRAA